MAGKDVARAGKRSPHAVAPRAGRDVDAARVRDGVGAGRTGADEVSEDDVVPRIGPGDANPAGGPAKNVARAGRRSTNDDD